MLTVKIYKDTSGNFKKSNIEFTNEKAFHLISSALISESNVVENNIENIENNNVKKMFQEQFDLIIEMLDQLIKPTIKQMREVD